MKSRIFLTVLLAASFATGCDSTDLFPDGDGGVIGPLTWTGSTLTIVGDDCDFFVASDTLTVDITIEGSTVTMVDTDPDSSLTASTNDYAATDDTVRLTGTFVNEEYPPCKASLEDAFTLELGDPNLSLDENQTVQVTWDHVERDVSDIPGDCAGEWFVDLDCSGEATFTFTQEAP